MSQTLQSVGYALRILLLLRTHPVLGVTEVAAHLGIGASTAHRLLSTLQEYKFVQQTEAGRRYQLGAAMTLSTDAAAIEHCIEVGFPVMEHLRDESTETVHISVLSGTQSKFVAVIESPRMMRVTSRVGKNIPAHTSAAGKVLLAELSDVEIDELYPEEQLGQVTESSIATRAALKAELQTVRERGFAINRGESEEGLAAVAVPLRRPGGRAICCLTLTGPLTRFNPDLGGNVSAREREFLEMLFSHAAQIERELTY